MKRWLMCWLVLGNLSLMPWGWPAPAQAFPPLTNVNAAVSLFTHKVTFDVYDPSRSQRVYGSQEGLAPVIAFVHRDGIVAWVRQTDETTQELWYTTYDPGRGVWKTGTQPYRAISGSPGLDNVQIGDGVLVWRIKNEYHSPVYFTSYDPESGSWQLGFHDAWLDLPGIKVAQGIVAFYGSSSRVMFYIYDPFSKVWREGSFDGTNIVDLYIQDFTVKVGTDSGGSGTQIYTMIYDYGSDIWIPSSSIAAVTQPMAYFVIQPGDTSFLGGTRSMRFWITDMSIGATGWSYKYDDSKYFFFSSRSLWRIYNKTGMHYIHQQISGPGGTDQTYGHVFYSWTETGFVDLLLLD
jgi:hypothetical protein